MLSVTFVYNWRHVEILKRDDQRYAGKTVGKGGITSRTVVNFPLTSRTVVNVPFNSYRYILFLYHEE